MITNCMHTLRMQVTWPQHIAAAVTFVSTARLRVHGAMVLQFALVLVQAEYRCGTTTRDT